MINLRKLLLLAIFLSVLLDNQISLSAVYADDPTPTPISPTSLPTTVPTQTPAPTSAPASTTAPTPTPDTYKTDKLNDLQQQIKDLQNKIFDKQSEEKTLSSQIGVMDNQIKLTQLRINEAQQELADITKDIKTTTQKITSLDASLNNLVKVLLERIKAGYQVGESTHPFEVLLSSDNAATFLARSNYLRVVQAHDRRLIIDTEQAKSDYKNQKNIFEEKKRKAQELAQQLQGYTAELSQQKKDKDALLINTKNDEAIFQRQLAAALAESSAIQGILSNGGNATFVGDIKKGDRVGQMIPGFSACSSGTHLHFEVHKNSDLQNPANYLSSTDVKWNNGSDGSFAFTGSWDWPLDQSIEIEQGFGMTSWARTGYYGGGPHTGIDMYSYASLRVHSVQDGKMYRGGVSCGGGTLLFARVDQSEGVQVYYFHILP